MSNVTPYQAPGAPALPELPAHLQGTPAGASQDSIGAGVGSSYEAPPRLSIEGRIFRMIKGDVNQPIVVRDPQTGQPVAVTSLNMVILDGNPGRHKTFYAAKYNPNDSERPLCYSYDGLAPSPYAEQPQSVSCATCPMNKFGSAINDQGNETKRCSDSKLLAVLPEHVIANRLAPGAPGADVYQIRVSATALNRSREDRKNNPHNTVSLAEYLAMLDRYPTGPNSAAAVPAYKAMTNFYFEIGPQYPLLRFRLARFLNLEEIAYVESRRQGEDVKACVTDPGVSFGGSGGTAPNAALPAPAYGATPGAALPPPPQPQAAPPAAPYPQPQAAPYPQPQAAPAAPQQGYVPPPVVHTMPYPGPGYVPAGSTPAAPAAPPAAPAIPQFGAAPAAPAPAAAPAAPAPRRRGRPAAAAQAAQAPQPPAAPAAAPTAPYPQPAGAPGGYAPPPPPPIFPNGAVPHPAQPAGTVAAAPPGYAPAAAPPGYAPAPAAAPAPPAMEDALSAAMSLFSGSPTG